MPVVGGRRRWLLLASSAGFLLIILHLLSGSSDFLDRVPIPGREHSDESLESSGFGLQYEPVDNHPISVLIAEADKRWREYEDSRSLTFKETVSKYRRRYNRHPPPGFVTWYRYARDKNVHNIDDFDQVMDDIRPFWAVPPKVLRNLAAHMWENEKDGVETIHIRNHAVVKISNNQNGWRADTTATLIEKFIDHLPDMDIATNRLDQPRVVVPWNDLQDLLDKESKSRIMIPDANDGFTANMTGLTNLATDKEKDNSTREDAGWYGASGQQYMDIAKTACPPESYAAGSKTMLKAEESWKDPHGGVVTNFNLSTDLCTIGPDLQDKHGFLFTASTILATKRLVPIFSECKVSVNNDILFPANMYWKRDDRYDYNSHGDVNWKHKKDAMIWRGVTSGGTQLADNWQGMHRQRLVQMLNGTFMAQTNVSMLSEKVFNKAIQPGEYQNFTTFNPSSFLRNHTDVGFVETWGCIPDCSFYDHVFELRPETQLTQQFQYKYLVDVDGHSFSGRWHAFLESRALGIKATIFREWHDSRLFPWRHFVPMDNRFIDLYTILTYFIGIGTRAEAIDGHVFVPKHDEEAKRLALQGSEWSSKVLRRDDIEVRLNLRLTSVFTLLVSE